MGAATVSGGVAAVRTAAVGCGVTAAGLGGTTGVGASSVSEGIAAVGGSSCWLRRAAEL